MARAATAGTVGTTNTRDGLDQVSYSCGIDVGVKNLSITFLDLNAIDSEPAVTSYYGPIERLIRYEMGTEPSIVEVKTRGDKDHEVYISIFDSIPEFRSTVSTVIEMQLAMNRSGMSRLDGVAYGYLRGRYPSMLVNLNASTIRSKFIATSIESSDPSTVVVPRGYPATKTPSFLYTGCLFPAHYDYIRSCEDIGKLDDLCDSLVYANLAKANLIADQKPKRGRRG